MDFNPILTEIQSHMQAMSPGAQAVVSKMGAPPPVDPGMNTVPKIAPGILLPHPDTAPPTPTLSMGSPGPSLSMPAAPNVTSLPAGRGNILGDTNERTRLLSTGPGVDQIANSIEGSNFGQAHPTMGRLLGDTAQVAGKIGDTALNIGGSLGIPAINTLARDIPGTTQHHEQLLGRANTALGQDIGNAQKEAQTANETATAGKTNAETPEVAPEAEARIGQENATAGEATARANELNNPPANLATAYAHAVSEAIKRGDDPAKDPIVGHLSDAIVALQPKQNTPVEAPKTIQVEVGGKPHQMAWNPATGKYDLDQGESGEKPPVTRISTGASEKNLWSVPQPDGSNKVVSLTPGMTIPKGAVSLSGQSAENSKAGGADAPTVAALKFANDYLQSGAFTGPSDEALQDQFFQLAKPSTGFRMNQAQISQLHDMSSWMNSIRGRAYHAINGTWFAPEQRAQIVQTMNNLASSKGMNAGEGQGGGSQHKVGDNVMLGGKQVTIKKLNPDGTFDY